MQPGVVEGARVQAHVHLALEPVLVHNRVSAVRGRTISVQSGGKREESAHAMLRPHLVASVCSRVRSCAPAQLHSTNKLCRAVGGGHLQGSQLFRLNGRRVDELDDGFSELALHDDAARCNNVCQRWAY